MHAPAQVPSWYEVKYQTRINDTKRRTFAGMLSCVDEGIGNVTKELERRNMMSNTLFVFTSDNGGAIQGGDSVGARNWPLRGGKHSIWEGGVRATSVVYSQNEDLISVERRGTTYNGLMHGADWFPTLSDVAGYDLNGTLELDGVSQWSAITGTDSRYITHSLTHSLNRTRYRYEQDITS